MNMTIEELQASLEKIRNSGTVPNSQKTISEDILIETSSMNMEEQVALSEMPEFQAADALFIKGFNAFLMNKFKSEFVNTDVGRQVAENLLEVIKSCKSFLLNKHCKELEEFRLWKKSQELSANEN